MGRGLPVLLRDGEQRAGREAARVWLGGHREQRASGGERDPPGCGARPSDWEQGCSIARRQHAWGPHGGPSWTYMRAPWRVLLQVGWQGWGACKQGRVQGL